MAFGGNQVNILITATDRASAKLAAVTRSGGKLAGAFAALRGPATIAAVATTAIGVAAVKTAMDFNKSFGQVGTLLGKVTANELEDMRIQLFRISNAIGVDVNQSVRGLYNAISAGVPKENIFEFMETAMKTAKAGAADLDTTIVLMAQVMNNYNLEAKDAERISDILFETVKGGITTMGALAQSLGDVLPLASASKISFEEVAGMMSIMTQQSGNTSKSVTALRALFVELARPTTKLAEALEENVGAFDDLIAEGVPVAKMLNDLREIVGEQEFKALFGSTEAMQGALQSTGANLPKVTEAFENMTTAAGTMEEALETVESMAGQELQNQMIILKNEWTNLSIEMLPVLISLAEDLVDAVQLIKSAADDWARFKKTLGQQLRMSVGWVPGYKGSGIDNYLMGIPSPPNREETQFGSHFDNLGSEIAEAARMGDWQEVFAKEMDRWEKHPQARLDAVEAYMDKVYENPGIKAFADAASEAATKNKESADKVTSVMAEGYRVTGTVNQVFTDGYTKLGSIFSKIPTLLSFPEKFSANVEEVFTNQMDNFEDAIYRGTKEGSAEGTEEGTVKGGLKLDAERTLLQAAITQAAFSGTGPFAMFRSDILNDASGINAAVGTSLLNQRNRMGGRTHVPITGVGPMLQGSEEWLTGGIGRVGTHQISPNQFVTINIAGEVFMTDESGQKISDLLNKVASSNGAATLSDLALGQT